MGEWDRETALSVVPALASLRALEASTVASRRGGTGLPVSLRSGTRIAAPLVNRPAASLSHAKP